MLYNPSLVKDEDFYGVVDLLCRLVVDEWLELKFPSPETGQDMLSAVQTLRSMWSHLLEMKLQASQCESSHTSSNISYLIVGLFRVEKYC